jgi:hypothetical protein
VVLDDFANDEFEKLFGEIRIQIGGFRQIAQPGHLLGLAGAFRVGLARARSAEAFSAPKKGGGLAVTRNR